MVARPVGCGRAFAATTSLLWKYESNSVPSRDSGVAGVEYPEQKSSDTSDSLKSLKGSTPRPRRGMRICPWWLLATFFSWFATIIGSISSSGVAMTISGTMAAYGYCTLAISTAVCSWKCVSRFTWTLASNVLLSLLDCLLV